MSPHVAGLHLAPGLGPTGWEGPSVSPPTFTTSLGLPPQPSHCSLKHKTNGGQECPQPGVQPRVLISLALHR